jgi:hypothetical protein
MVTLDADKSVSLTLAQIPVTTADLFITSSPQGTLTIDGASFGTTPMTANLATGMHTISVSKDGYVTNTTTYTLTGPATLSLTLAQNGGSGGGGGAVPSASLSVAPWFPQGRNYVFLCNATGFVPKWYDFDFGDGNKNAWRTQSDVYYTYPTAGTRTVTCTARDDTKSVSSSIVVTVA